MRLNFWRSEKRKLKKNIYMQDYKLILTCGSNLIYFYLLIFLFYKYLLRTLSRQRLIKESEY